MRTRKPITRDCHAMMIKFPLKKLLLGLLRKNGLWRPPHVLRMLLTAEILCKWAILLNGFDQAAQSRSIRGLRRHFGP